MIFFWQLIRSSQMSDVKEKPLLPIVPSVWLAEVSRGVSTVWLCSGSDVTQPALRYLVRHIFVRSSVQMLPQQLQLTVKCYLA